jgi:hypothetical protein
VEEAGPYTKAPPKLVDYAETRTALKVRYPDGSLWVGDVRTIVVKEQGSRGKERWHALWVFRDETTPAWDIVEEFRLRQHHEQRYRMLVYDAFVDTAPSGYDKESKDVEHPLFDEAALTLYAWIAAVVTNVVEEFSEQIPQFHRAHLRTLRRWFFAVPAELYHGRGTLIVYLQPRRAKELWLALIQTTNARSTRIPWLDDRRLILSMAPPIPQPDPATDTGSPF